MLRSHAAIVVRPPRLSTETLPCVALSAAMVDACLCCFASPRQRVLRLPHLVRVYMYFFAIHLLVRRLTHSLLCCQTSRVEALAAARRGAAPWLRRGSMGRM